MTVKLTAFVLATLLLMDCSKTETRTYELRSYGTWTVGETRTSIFARDIDDAPCFTPEQIQNGAPAAPALPSYTPSGLRHPVPAPPPL